MQATSEQRSTAPARERSPQSAIAKREGSQRSVQLDGLRIFAMGGILFHHFASVKAGNVGAAFGWGCLQLFLALSGFLTTKVLLRDRKDAEAAGQSSWRALGMFYIRRSLRIFPVYYLLITFAFIFNVHHMREVFVWLATYTTNFYLCLTENWDKLGHYAHLWSLSVQEQFYGFWALVMLFAPKRRLIGISLGMIAAAPIYRLTAVLLGWSDSAISFSTLSCLDTIGMGALLALAMRESALRDRLDAWLTRAALPLGVAGSILLTLIDRKFPHINGIGYNLAVGLIVCWILYKAIRGFRGPAGWVLEQKPVVYLGRISYGIFLYHFMVPGTFGPMLRGMGLDFTDGGLTAFALYTSITVVVASISWHLIEKPINGLKDHFRVEPERAASTVTHRVLAGTVAPEPSEVPAAVA